MCPNFYGNVTYGIYIFIFPSREKSHKYASATNHSHMQHNPYTFYTEEKRHDLIIPDH